MMAAPLFVFFFATFSQLSALEDLASCKLSHSGVDYRGPASKSFSGPRCRFWDSRDIPHSKFDDGDFPDGSKKAAGNKCRNPTGQKLGPWCYTVDPNVVLDVCDVPLCSFKTCRASGPGVEYAGNLGVSGAGESCLQWSGISKYKKHNPNIIKVVGRSFPDGSVKWAGRKCRNPDGHAGGPWCYVKSRGDEGNDKRVRRANCDVPVCNLPDCTMFTTYDEPVHSDFVHFNESGLVLKFSVRLWDPSEWKSASLRLAVSLLAVPGAGQQQLTRKTGFEVVISNSKAFFTGFEGDWTKIPAVLTASNWTHLRVTWGDEYITLLREGQQKALLVQDFPTKKHTLDGQKRVTMKVFAVSGRNILWHFPNCGDQCPVHVSSRETFSRLWVMRGSPTGYGVQLFVRSRSAVCLQLRETPNSPFPGLRICLDDHNSSYVSYRSHAEATELRLKEVKSGRLLSWWSWQEFSVSLSGSTLSLRTKSLSGPGVVVLESEIPEEATGSRWFGVAPLGGVALFTLFCIPEEEPALPTPPECYRSESALYVGTEWTTASGQPCLPWSDPELKERMEAQLRDDSLYPDGSIEGARNFCRNPGRRDREGPFCYAVRPHGSVGRQHCALRPCRSADCRLAGTANDYMGRRNVSRSGWPCRPWAQAAVGVLANSSLYPEQSVQDAKNFCRNPSRSVAGAWCYTEDEHVRADLCSVRDCEAVEECTVVYRGGKGAHRDQGGVYVLPTWRDRGLYFSLKEWNPERTDGMVLDLSSFDSESLYRLTIGAEKNEKVTFGFVPGRGGGKEQLLSSKTVPHIVSAGRWAALWLRMPMGRVLLGLAGVHSPIFEWPYKEEDFMPHLIAYRSVQGQPIGVQFECSDCHIERVHESHFTKLFPWRLWLPDGSGSEPVEMLTLFLQGPGTARLALYRLPEESHYIFLIGSEISLALVSGEKKEPQELARSNAEQLFLQNNTWTRVQLIIRQKLVNVTWNGTVVLSWRSPSPLPTYFFSVGAERGHVTWAANCEPADISAHPQHGGWSAWSAWSCSVPCGGGRGRRERSCSKPAPNILGRPCKGAASAQGPCNEWPCGHLSPHAILALRAGLQAGANQVRVEPGSQARMPCGRQAVASVRREAPASRIVWIKDGELVNSTDDRRVIVGDEVTVSRALGSDSGVWTCLAVLGNSRVVLAVWAVSVRRRVPARLSTRLDLHCHALQLALIYGHLRVRWARISPLHWYRFVWKYFGAQSHESCSVTVRPQSSAYIGITQIYLTRRKKFRKRVFRDSKCGSQLGFDEIKQNFYQKFNFLAEKLITQIQD